MIEPLRRLFGSITGKAIVDGNPLSRVPLVAAVVKKDPEATYLNYLRESNKYLLLRGLLHGHIPQIQLADIYISLKAVAGDVSERALALSDSLTLSSEDLPMSTRTQLADTSFYDREQRISSKIEIEQLLSTYPRITILGEPGSGKTTFVRYLVAKMISEGERYGRELGLTRLPTPILITLRSIDPNHLPGRNGVGELCIPEILRDDVPPSFVASLIDRGSCVFIFDGLDEVTDPTARRHVTRWIEDLASVFGTGNRFIVTSRIVGFREAPVGAGFEKFTLCEFDVEDTRSFIYRWYEAVANTVFATDPELRQREVVSRSEKLLEVMRSKPGIQELAHNPLLLTIVLLVYSNRASLPEERGKLYSECIDVLLEHLQQSRLEESYQGSFRPVQHLTLDQRRDLLKSGARWLHEQGITHSDRETLSRASLDPILPGMGFGLDMAGFFLKEVEERSGLLTERSGGLGFSHLAFQEFLTALCFAQDESENDAIPILVKVRFRSWWREVIQLYATLVSDASLLLDTLIRAEDSRYAHNVLLAGACLADARRVRDLPVRQAVITRLVELYSRSEYSYHRRNARELLVRIGGAQVEELFAGILEAAGTDVLSLLDAVEVLARLRLRGGAIKSLERLLTRENIPEQVRLGALRGARTADVGSTQLREILFDLIEANRSPAVRQEAVTTLGHLYRDADTIEQVRTSVLEAVAYSGVLDDFYVATLKAFIGQLEPGAALRILDEKLAVPQSAEFKVELCRSLLLVRLDERKLTEKLTAMLKDGVDWGVRGGAALLLGLSRVNRREIAHFLSERLSSDRELGVGLRIADALSHLGWRDDDVIESLRKALREDTHIPTVRKLIEAYATLTRDDVFIRERIVGALEDAATLMIDKVEGFAVLERLRYSAEDVTSRFITQLDRMQSDVAKACLRYLASTCRIPVYKIDTMRLYLERVLADNNLDPVLRDRAFESMYDLFGISAAETAAG